MDIVNNGILIWWQPTPRANRYTVFWGPESGQHRYFVEAEQPPILLLGIQKGQLNYFAVTAWNEFGESMYSAEVALVNDNNSANAGFYLKKGHECARKEAFIDAHAYYSAVIRLDPRRVDAYLYRGAINQKLKREEMARSDFIVAEKMFKDQRLSLRQAKR